MFPGGECNPWGYLAIVNKHVHKANHQRAVHCNLFGQKIKQETTIDISIKQLSQFGLVTCLYCLRSVRYEN